MCEDSILSTTFTTANLNAACNVPASSLQLIRDQHQLKVIPFLAGLDADDCDGDEDDEEDDEVEDDELVDNAACGETSLRESSQEALFGEIEVGNKHSLHRSDLRAQHLSNNNNNHLSSPQLSPSDATIRMQRSSSDESSSSGQRQQHLISLQSAQQQQPQVRSQQLSSLNQTHQLIRPHQQQYQQHMGLQHQQHQIQQQHQLPQHQHSQSISATTAGQEDMFGQQLQLLSGHLSEANNNPHENTSTSGPGSSASNAQSGQSSHHYLTNAGAGSLPPFCTL